MSLHSYDDQALDDGYEDFEDEDEEMDADLFNDELDYDDEEEDGVDGDSDFGSMDDEDDYDDFD